MSEECDHYIGEKDFGYDGGYLVSVSKRDSNKMYELNDFADIVFNYCPLCGVKLEVPK